MDFGLILVSSEFHSYRDCRSVLQRHSSAFVFVLAERDDVAGNKVKVESTAAEGVLLSARI